MGLFSEAKHAARVFLKTPDKGTAIKKSLLVLKNKGISGLKSAINEAGQMQEEIKDLYEKQQLVKKEYQEYAQSILFVIWSLQANVDISDTYSVTAKQMKKQDRIVVIKTEEKSVWEDSILCEKIICERQNICAYLQRLMAECEQDYVYFIKGGNYLAPNMRDEFAETIHMHNASVIYSDECVYSSEDGKIIRYDVATDFSEYDLYQANNNCQSVAFMRGIAMKLFEKNLRIECIENMMLYLMLRARKETKEIVHLEQVLLFKKDILEEQNLEESRWILARHLNEQNIPVNIIIQYNKLKLCTYNGQHKASIIILAEQLESTKQCIKELIRNTAHADYEVLIVGETKLFDDLSKDIEIKETIKHVLCDKMAPYTTRCNIAAQCAEGDILVFMQETMQVQYAEWLSELLGIFAYTFVGGVSPRIVREDKTFRYAGMISGGFGFTPIPFNGENSQHENDNNRLAFLNRQVSVLSASCMAIRKVAFKAVGGFDEINFTDKFSNAQMSFALARSGYACVYCADSVLTAKDSEWYDSWYINEHPTAYIQLLKHYGEELSKDAYFTESMKCLFLRGVPVDFRIYQKKNDDKEDGKRILMISHDSLLGGATIAFQYAARALKKVGYYVVWLAAQEGPMLEELEKDEIVYIVDPSFRGSQDWLNYAKNFDLVICNTILLCRQVEKIKNAGIKVIWWIHEASDYYKSHIISDFTKANLDKLKVWCVGSFSGKKFEENFAGIPMEIMAYGLPDYTKDASICFENVIENPRDKMIFLSIGTIERRKGQDILSEAIRKLDTEVRDQCLFVFVGKEIQSEVYEEVHRVVADYPETVTYMGTVNRNTIMQMYRQSDVVLCTSREDPMPVFMTECMMQSRVAICSENTGTAGVLTDRYDGFIYHDNNVNELVEKITYVLKNKDKMQQIRINARQTYEKYFSMEVFEQKLRVNVEKILKE